ncbi:MAG: TPM domain-containing protein [Candidatus Margulisiibacteriota bacterium]
MRSLSIILVILFFLVLPVHSQEITFPEKQNTVTDYFGDVDLETKTKIAELAKELRRITSINFEVAVLRSTDPLDAETYGRKLYDVWDVGRKAKGLDHGILLLVVILDREVKVIAGEGVDHILTPSVKESLEWGIFPSLGRGEISKGVFIGSTAITRLVLEGWPRYERRWKPKINPRNFSIMLFALCAAAILLTIIFGGTFLTVFGTIVGGLFGYFLLGVFGLFVGATIGFLLNVWKVKKEKSLAETELKKVYDEWKEQKRKEKRGL